VDNHIVLPYARTGRIIERNNRRSIKLKRKTLISDRDLGTSFASDDRGRTMRSYIIIDILFCPPRVVHVKSCTTPMIRREFGSLDGLDGARHNIIPIVLLFVIFIFFRRV